jgi:glycosyltransferase involved in cell wall biosynthesis
MKTPEISVLMPVYNGEKYLAEAIRSILDQDYKDFEFLIINDGSTDNSGKIISSFKDDRIRLLENGQNIGLVNTLNKGLDAASGKYIVRMDCDDISTKNRLGIQYKFMEENINVGASGSYYFLMRGNKKAVADFPLSDEEIKCFLLFNSPIPHPTAIIRRSVVKQYGLKYSSDYLNAEDYDFWSRVSENSALQNLPEKLLCYRTHSGQITTSGNSVIRIDSVTKIRMRQLEKLGILPTENEIRIHNVLSDGIAADYDLQLEDAEKWLLKIIAANKLNPLLNSQYLKKIIFERWLRLCFNVLGARTGISYFLQSILYSRNKLKFSLKMSLLKSLYYSWRRKSIKPDPQ